MKQHLRDVLKTCREIWVKFDAQLISYGLTLTFLGLFAMYVLIINSTPSQLHAIFDTSIIRFILSSNVIIGVLSYFFYRELRMPSKEVAILFCTSTFSIFICVYLSIKNWENISENMSKVKHFRNVVTRISFAFTTCVFFANSFIIEESKILSYVLVGLFIVILYEFQHDSNFKIVKFKFAVIRKSTFVKLAALAILGISLIRYSSYYFRCREEQGNCTDFTVRNPIDIAKRGHDVDFMPIISLAIFVTSARMYLRSCGNLHGFSSNVILARYGPTIGAICTSIHLILTKSNRQILHIHFDAYR